MQASCRALCPNGYGSESFHKDNGTPRVDDRDAAFVAVMKARNESGLPGDAASPHPGERPHVLAVRVQGAHIAERENDSDKKEVWLYAEAKQRGPGSKMLPIERENQALEDKFRAELSKLSKPAELEMARQFADDAKKEKAERLREEIRAILQSLPEHLRTGSQVQSRLRPDDPVAGRTVRRHILALKLRAP